MSLRSGAFLETLIAVLLPYFAAAAADTEDARAEILETLASYATRTRAEALQAAQIIALSMTALDVLHDAKTAEMSMSMRIRFRGCANGLNRATLQMEKSLNRSLACDVPDAGPMPDPIDDLPDDQFDSAIEQARVAIEAHRNQLPADARPEMLNDLSRQIWAAAMLEALTPAPQAGCPPLGAPLALNASERR